MARSYGIIATFETPAALYHAAEACRDKGFQKWDTFTPFPVHGLDEAMGIKRSRVPILTFLGGITGFTLGMSMVYFMNKVDYPLIVGGKPYFSPIFPFPVAYELTILLAAFGTLAGMFLFNRLPMHYHPVLKWEKFNKITDDQFLIAIEASDPLYESETVRTFLAELGGKEIQEIED